MLSRDCHYDISNEPDPQIKGEKRKEGHSYFPGPSLRTPCHTAADVTGYSFRAIITRVLRKMIQADGTG